MDGAHAHGAEAGGWPHFSAVELACRHCGRLCMDPAFMRRLELLRGEFGRPMRLSSAYRCPAYDADIGGAGAHPTGHAVDVLIHGEAAFRLVALAVRRGFTGIGLHQRGPYAGRFVHLDDCPDERASGGARARPRIWTY